MGGGHGWALAVILHFSHDRNMQFYRIFCQVNLTWGGGMTLKIKTLTLQLILSAGHLRLFSFFFL